MKKLFCRIFGHSVLLRVENLTSYGSPETLYCIDCPRCDAHLYHFYMRSDDTRSVFNKVYAAHGPVSQEASKK